MQEFNNKNENKIAEMLKSKKHLFRSFYKYFDSKVLNKFNKELENLNVFFEQYIEFIPKIHLRLQNKTQSLLKKLEEIDSKFKDHKNKFIVNLADESINILDLIINKLKNFISKFYITFLFKKYEAEFHEENVDKNSSFAFASIDQQVPCDSSYAKSIEMVKHCQISLQSVLKNHKETLFLDFSAQAKTVGNFLNNMVNSRDK
ncbi:hypothetical protein EDEG_02653 [Edhazardia aedis USNM 41457]|uniref:Uncharacterized protein n=1 Tax=Edhazardia aedis (strain USNM 41457) TaxID=1003232 RepID=J8ZTE7_EDHAE|nr:hypothetical protein EDEG_02653 [Edhazardia aedis USNM 41457]|eukprot:EJW02958.1 hypothetical protein EDEG_02653 [Edhazardia aedis USNM 41457]